jgi:hypothetical protein
LSKEVSKILALSNGIAVSSSKTLLSSISCRGLG